MKKAITWTLLAGGSLACSKPPPQARPTLQYMESFTMTQSASGKKVWELQAPGAEIHPSKKIHLDRPKILFYREGRHASTTNSNKASVHPDSRNVELRGDVLVVSHEDQTVLKTQSLDYIAQRGFHTDAPVLIERPGARMQGRGLDADASLETIHIYHQETDTQTQ